MSIARFARSRIAGWVSALAAGLLLSACSASEPSGPVSETAAGLDTIKPGVLTVAIQPYMPYTALVGDKLTGLDSDIINAVADKLGLKVETQVTDFAGMLAGVQSRRVDITVGGVAWTAERQKQGLFTDPPYYSPPAMAVRSGQTFRTVNDLEGLDLGTVKGYVWVKSIQAVPGAKLHAYPDGNGVFDDLGAGRIDVGFLDPLIIIAAQKERPGLSIETQYLTPPTAQQVEERPAYEFFRPYMTSFYLPKQAPKLEKAISAEIRSMYQSGDMKKLIEKWGGDPKGSPPDYLARSNAAHLVVPAPERLGCRAGTPNQFLKPSPDVAPARRGVDRPQDWEPPSV
jgi:polar amino acid transport system substrate-binding protein